ncbi:hypothetical protein EDB83DRAFT_353200 [Lactarius deliciosus]|nr:hypothetical protein EDB83DRAFT_353200 [Lactarius deliciosus]
MDVRVRLRERCLPTCVLPTRFGPRRVVVATAVALGMLSLFPFENMLARGTGTVSVVWSLIVLQLVAISVSDMGFIPSPPVHKAWHRAHFGGHFQGDCHSASASSPRWLAPKLLSDSRSSYGP